MNQEPDPVRSKMVIDFFNNPQTDKKLNDLCYNFINRYNFTSKRLKYGDDIFEAVQKDIASVLKYFYTKENLISSRNFHRKNTKDGYLYSSLPRTTNNVLPKETSPQLAMDFELKEQKETSSKENTTMDENSLLFEDILASDKINDPIQSIVDKYTNIDLYGIDEFQLTTTKGGKKITIIIANA